MEQWPQGESTDRIGFRGRWSNQIMLQFPVFASTNVQQLVFGEALLVSQALVSSGGSNKLVFNDSGKFSLTKNGQTTNFFLPGNVSGVAMLVFDRTQYDWKPTLTLRNNAGDTVWTASLGESSVGQRYRSQMEYYRKEVERMRGQYGYEGERMAEKNRPNRIDFDNPVFKLKDDGSGAIVWFENDTVWNLNNLPSSNTDNVKDTLNVGDRLKPGESIWSPSKAYQLVYQTDGNLVTYKTDGNRAVWASASNSSNPGYVATDAYGQLQVFNSSGVSIWTSKSNSSWTSSSTTTKLRNDGNLVTSGAWGGDWWVSGTR